MMYGTIFAEADFQVEKQFRFFEESKADTILQDLKKYNFQALTRAPQRKIAAFGDDGLLYSFKGSNIEVKPWTPCLLEIRDQIERHTGCSYNFVLLNRLENGGDYIPQHRHAQNSPDSTFPVAIASFGERRTMNFKKPMYETQSIDLQPCSLLLIQHPTYENYTCGVPPDILKQDVHIHLLFKHILKTSGEKKIKMELFDSSTQCIPRPSTSLLQQWNLEDHVFAQVHLENQKLRLHIRQFAQAEDGILIPTKSGIVMLNSTWTELYPILLNFNFKNSHIMNKQLLLIPLDNNQCIMQQMFNSWVSGFFLKPCTLKLRKSQILKLKDYISEISHCLIQARLTKVFPNLILSEGIICHDHYQTEEEAKQYLLSCIQSEIELSLSNYFPCMGCHYEERSLFNHECTTKSFEEKFFIYRDRILLTVDLNKITEKAVARCTCYFTYEFFTTFQFPYLSEYMEEYVNNLK